MIYTITPAWLLVLESHFFSPVRRCYTSSKYTFSLLFCVQIRSTVFVKQKLPFAASTVNEKCKRDPISKHVQQLVLIASSLNRHYYVVARLLATVNYKGPALAGRTGRVGAAPSLSDE